jgi:atypical dual specificity phosphatase
VAGPLWIGLEHRTGDYKVSPRAPRSFSFVVDGVLAGLARPCGDDVAALPSRGIAGLVSLTEAPLDRDAVARQGLEYLHLPVRDFGAPSMETVKTFVEFVRRVRAERGGAVAVHCGSGMGRTGTMLACFLVSEGRRAEEAIAEVRRLRPGSIETDGQESAVRGWEGRPGSGPDGHGSRE